MTRIFSLAVAPRGAAGMRSFLRFVSSLLVLVVAVFAAGMTARQAVAATYYVDNTNPAASDAGPGSASIPYRTLSAAISQHGGAGNVVRALAGTYREQISLSVNGAAGNPFVVEAASQAVVIDGADSFTSASQWTLLSGNVWLASGVTWAPVQVFADDAELTASALAPASLPGGTFQYVAGAGLYVNAGGGSPAGHGTLVGRRRYGFSGYTRSWITIRGFSILRADDVGVNLGSASNNCEITDCRLSLSASYGVALSGCSAIRLARNTITYNGDHGMSFGGGTNGCTVEDNESAYNVYPPARQANGIDLFGSVGNRIQRNRFHHNQDTGLNLRSNSNNNVCVGNLSWSNGDHGIDNVLSSGNIHLNEVTWGNYRDGFSIEGGSSGTQLFNCIGVDNGLATGGYDLWVDAASTPGFTSNDNFFWKSTAQAPIRYIATNYTTLAPYVAASGQDTRSILADPRFVNAAGGDFHLLAGSRAIDSGNSSHANWPASDTEGRARFDDPATANSGVGSVAFSDRGPFEFTSATPTPQSPNGVIDTPTGNVSIVQGQSVSFTGTGSDPDNQTPFAYLWDFGGGAANQTVEDPGAVTFNSVGVFTVTFRVTDAAGLPDPTPATRTVTVNAAPTPQPPNGVIDTPTGNVSIVQGQSVSFTGTGSDPDNQTPFAYLWDFGGGAANQTVEDPGAVTFNSVGVFTVTFRVTDAAGLPDPTPATRTVTVNAVDRLPVVTASSSRTVNENVLLTINVSASDPDGQPISALTMDVSGLPPGSNATFVPGTGNTTGTFTWRPTYSDSGSWSVTFRAVANGATGQSTTAIRVVNVDRAPVVTAPTPVRVTRGTVAIVDVTASDPDGDAITQLTADISALPSGNDARFIPGPGNTSGRLTWTTRTSDGGRWKVPFTARNALSKTATTTIRVVNSALAANSTEDMVEPEPRPLSVALSSGFPNPTPGTVAFRLALPTEAEVEWSVVDIQGREVWRGRDTRSPGWSTIGWDGRTLAGARAGAGIYLVRVRAGENHLLVKRFVRL